MRDAPACCYHAAMSELSLRLLLLLHVVVPLLFFTASVYLALHVLFARFIIAPNSPVLWFFSVLTRPLTRPVQAILPWGVSEARLRTLSLAFYVVLWLASRSALNALIGVRPG